MRLLRRILLIGSLALGAGSTPLVAQATDQELIKTNLKNFFSCLDRGDIEGLASLVATDVEVFDSTYPLRIDGVEEFKSYLGDLQGFIGNLKTSIRQPRLRLLGEAAVVNFYYSQDYIVMKEPVEENTENEPVISLSRERTTDIGRGTIIFAREQDHWKAVTIHLSQFPAPIF